jgi:hypothetical protein
LNFEKRRRRFGKLTRLHIYIDPTAMASSTGKWEEERLLAPFTPM